MFVYYWFSFAIICFATINFHIEHLCSYWIFFIQNFSSTFYLLWYFMNQNDPRVMPLASSCWVLQPCSLEVIWWSLVSGLPSNWCFSYERASVVVKTYRSSSFKKENIYSFLKILWDFLFCIIYIPLSFLWCTFLHIS